MSTTICTVQGGRDPTNGLGRYRSGARFEAIVNPPAGQKERERRLVGRRTDQKTLPRRDESELKRVSETGKKVIDRCAHERDRDNCGHGDERQD